MAGTVLDRGLFNTSEYAIFFDNVRVDQFVVNWSTQGGVDGEIGSASLEMIYLPDLYRLHSPMKNLNVGDANIEESQEIGEGIENMTNLRIFVRNVYTGKYCCVFDGNIKSKSLTKSGNGKRITFSASDYLTWLNRTIVPLAIPGEDRLTFPDRMRWKAQGINLESIPFVAQWRDIHFRGKNIEEVWNEITERTIKSNLLYSRSEVATWDNPLGRVIQMADIDPKFTKEQSALDFIVTAEASSMNSIYVMMNDLIKSMLLEFFQNGAGQICIKAPFWSEPILKDHVIDPTMILNFSESVNWDAEYSRIIATGGLEWWEGEYSETTKSYVMPTVAYRTDGKYADSSTNMGDTTDYVRPADVSGSTTGTWLDRYGPPTSLFGPRNVPGASSDHKGIDYAMPKDTPVRHIGANGVVITANYGSATAGNYVEVRLERGSYSGYVVRYLHLNSISVTVGASVNDGSLIGYSGNTGQSVGKNGGYHLHFAVRTGSGQYINPLIYLTGTGSSTDIGNYKLHIGNDDLMAPSDYERKYGPSIFNVNQPMIKFSTSGAVDTNRQPMFEMLTSYAKFMLNYLNSAVNVASLQAVAMPWLKLGFNVWVDPIGIDKVYYISSISYQGSAENGVYMNLGLTLGRTLSDYANGRASIASLTPGHSQNIFINQLKDGYIVSRGDFGKIVGTKASDYGKFRTSMLKFHMGMNTTEPTLIKSISSKYYQDLYGEGIVSKKINTKSTSSQNKSSNTSKIDPSKWARTLQRGDTGKDVEELQQLLINLNYNLGDYGADGKFGNKTRDAVIAFQKANGLTADGKVGPKTRAAFMKEQAVSNTTLSESTSLLRRGSEGKYVKELQRILTVLGYKPGTIDGIFGRQTESALKEFQVKNGLQVDGIVGPKTKAALLNNPSGNKKVSISSRHSNSLVVPY